MAVAPEREPVTVSPVMKPLFAVMNNLELETISSAKTVDVAPDVEPVITSPFLKEPAKSFSSATSLSPKSKPAKAFVLSNNIKLFAVASVSKSM